MSVEKEAEDPVLLDLRGLANFCDYFVIVSSSSSRRAQAISDNIQNGLDRQKIPIRAQEQDDNRNWILLDLYDVVVHIFDKQTRQYYNLQKLWQDAKKLTYPPKKHVCSKPIHKRAKQSYRRSSAKKF